MCILVAAPSPLRQPDLPEEAAMNIDEAEHEVSAEEKDERRRHSDRRKRTIPVAVERRSGKDRRLEKDKEKEGERRRQVDPTTCEKDYNVDEIAFMQAMDLYKRRNRRPFPTWSEVLE